jgi:hypothetical protein
MGGYFRLGIPVIDGGFENLDLLARDACPAQAANQFICLAAEHRAANDLNDPCVMFHGASA